MPEMLTVAQQRPPIYTQLLRGRPGTNRPGLVERHLRELAAIRQRSVIKTAEFALDAWPEGRQIGTFYYQKVEILSPIWLYQRIGRETVQAVTERCPIYLVEGNLAQQIKASADDVFIPIRYREPKFEDQCAIIKILLEAPAGSVAYRELSLEEDIISPSHIDWVEHTQDSRYLKVYSEIDHLLLGEIARHFSVTGAGTNRPKPRILDVGCGRARLLAKIDKLLKLLGLTAELMGIEPEPTLVKAGQEQSQGRYSVQNASGLDIPFPDNHFDVVIAEGSVNVDVVTAGQGVRIKAEMHRVAAPGGLVLFSGYSPVVPSPGNYYGSPAPELETQYHCQKLTHLEISGGEHICCNLHSLVKK